MLISGGISQVPYGCKGIVSICNSFYIQNIRKAFENIVVNPTSFPNNFSAQGPIAHTTYRFHKHSYTIARDFCRK
jgi:hypothetical protein